MISNNAAGVVLRDAAFIKTFFGGTTPVLPAPTEFLQVVDSDATIGDKLKYLGMAVLKYNPITLAVEGVYKMGEAAINGDWEALRNESYNLLTLGALMKFGESAKLKRDMQLSVKNAEFLQQKLRRGVIEETPLRDLQFEPAGTKQYVIKPAKLSAAGEVIAESRIVTEEAFAKACDGILDINPDGSVVYKFCFAAGTLVHTDKGLIPIEKIRVGTQVLSQPEHGGEQAFRPVINTVAHLDKQVHVVQVKVQGADTLTTLIATPNHPFWVESPLADGQHWMATECLEPGFVLQLADGRKAAVHANGLVRRTQHESIGVAADDRVGVGIVLDLSERHIKLADDALAQRLDKLELGEPFLTPVYNFEVEEFHTYYVGDAAVWVHNTNCTAEGAVDAVFEKAKIEGECFSGDTQILMEPWMNKVKGICCDRLYIEQIEVGDTVLSRCETTGEMAYKQVTKVFTHGWTTSSTVFLDFGPEFHQPPDQTYPHAITTTAAHPFWVQGKGWTKVRDLLPGDELLTHTGLKANVKQVYLDNSKREVYNLEVEDFHTYFVNSSSTSDLVGIWVHNKSPLEFNRLNPNAVADPKPQWTPLHDSEAVLVQRKAALDQRRGELDQVTTKTPAEIQELKDVNRELTSTNIALNEIQPRKALGAADIQITMLPDKNAVDFSGGKLKNNLGRQDTVGVNPGYPDGVLTSIRYPDLNGVVADIYQPNRKGTIGNTFESIKDKSERQSSVIVVDLRGASDLITRDALLDVVRGKGPADFDVNGVKTQVKGPIETLRTLVIIDKDGGVIRVNFPDTGKNPIVYGTVRITDDGIYTDRLSGPPAAGTDVIKKDYSPLRDAGATYLKANAQGDGLLASPFTMADVETLLPAAKQYWLDAGAPGLNSVELSIAPLAPRVAAITLGNKITLSADGAGWGWFVDATPNAQEEFGAGDAANEYKATDGSAAQGKMDLLTVLVHELGHALGLGHVTGEDDLMAQYLEPGVRRLPSASDIAALQAGAGSAIARVVGVTFVQEPAVTLATQRGTAMPQYEVVVNPSLTNGQFTSSNGSLNTASGWATEGSVSIASGAATLVEAATTQTRLNQVFMVGPQDRYLSFTLSGMALDDAAAGPDDAFEVALLNANTGASLTSAIGLTHTDALLNLQANGAELAASGVTHVTNPDGSRTYLLDLTGVAAGTAVNLSFDLIGFGNTAATMGSHVTVSNVRRMGAAQTVDDSITTAEDTVAQIIALANDIGANQAGMAPVLVAAPQHGQVVVNLDPSTGSGQAYFSYTPAQNYFGPDSFTYRLSNGAVDSNATTPGSGLVLEHL